MLLDYYMGYGNPHVQSRKNQKAIPLLEKAVQLIQSSRDMETQKSQQPVTARQLPPATNRMKAAKEAPSPL